MIEILHIAKYHPACRFIDLITMIHSSISDILSKLGYLLKFCLHHIMVSCLLPDEMSGRT